MTRLATLSPALDARMLRLEPQALRLAASALLEHALTVATPQEDVRRICDAIARGAVVGEADLALLDKASSDFDDAYFEAQDAGREAEALALFGQARLTAGAAMLAGADRAEDLVEAAYELVMAVDDDAAALRLLEAALPRGA